MDGKSESRMPRELKQTKLENKNSAIEDHLKKLHEREKLADLKNGLIKERMKCAKLKDDLIKEDFYIISMAYFCRTMEDVYIPAELGAIKYSLECGVKKQLHMHINPGKIPTGLGYEALQHSENTHGLPIPPRALGLTDYGEIRSKLLCFLETNGETPVLLFTDTKDVPIVESMLKAILGNRMEKSMPYVCSLPVLFYQLQHGVEDCNKAKNSHLTMHMVQHMLGLDYFSYTPGISCEYHESQNLLVHCALSQCIRWAYTISKQCCNILDIKLVRGKHMPASVDYETRSTNYTFWKDNSDDESEWNANDNEIDDDAMSFVSYASDYTSIVSTNLVTCDTVNDFVCNDVRVQSPISKIDTLKQNGPKNKSVENGLESLSLHEFIPKPTNSIYSLAVNGHGVIHGHFESNEPGFQQNPSYDVMGRGHRRRAHFPNH